MISKKSFTEDDELHRVDGAQCSGQLEVFGWVIPVWASNPMQCVHGHETNRVMASHMILGINIAQNVPTDKKLQLDQMERHGLVALLLASNRSSLDSPQAS